MTGCYQLQMLFSGTVKEGGTTLHSDLASDHGRRNDDHDAIPPAPRGGCSPDAHWLVVWRSWRGLPASAAHCARRFISAGYQIQAGAVDDTMNVHHPVSHPTCIPEQEGRGVAGEMSRVRSEDR